MKTGPGRILLDVVRGREGTMPVVTIEWWEGYSDEQKRKVIQAISDVMVDGIGINRSHLHIIFYDIPRNCWAVADRLANDVKEERG